MKIRAVVFDYGKVICHPPPDSGMDKIAALSGVRRNVFEPVLWRLRSGYDNGTLTGIEYYRAVFTEVNADLTDDVLREILETDFSMWTGINHETVELMQEIKNSGLILGILSNMPFDFLRFARKEFGVFNLPHVAIFSCEAGVNKPEKAIYEKLLAAIDMHAAISLYAGAGSCCRPDEVVFFDDIPENVEAARDLKINACVWQDCEKARFDLNQLGVRLNRG